MSYTPRCGVCGKVITETFLACSDCETKYCAKEERNRVNDRPEWMNEMMRWERMRRYYLKRDSNNTQTLEALTDTMDIAGYVMDLQMLVEYREEFAELTVLDTDGQELFEIQDSDWEAVYTWSL